MRFRVLAEKVRVWTIAVVLLVAMLYASRWMRSTAPYDPGFPLLRSLSAHISEFVMNTLDYAMMKAHLNSTDGGSPRVAWVYFLVLTPMLIAIKFAFGLFSRLFRRNV